MRLILIVLALATNGTFVKAQEIKIPSNTPKIGIELMKGMGYTRQIINTNVLIQDLYLNNTQNVEYKGIITGPSIEFSVKLFYNFSNVKMGLGYGYETMYVDSVKALKNKHYFADGALDFSKTYFYKLSTYFEYTFYKNDQFLVAGALESGIFKLYINTLNTIEEVKKTAFAANISSTLEYSIAPRLSVFIQPNFDYKIFVINDYGVSFKYYSFKVSEGFRFYF